MSKKGRFYIQINEIFDNGFALGSMQDYVNIMNDLDKQNENKGKQIAELKQQLAEKEDFITTLGFKNEDKFREYVLNCLLNKEDKVNRIRELEQQLTEKEKKITSLQESLDWERKDKTIIVKQLDDPNDYVSLEDYKNSRHQICEKFREKYYKIQKRLSSFEFVNSIDVDKILDDIEKGE